MEFTREQTKALRAVSEEHMKFVQYAANNAHCLDRLQFKLLDEWHCAISARVQAWPTFVDKETIAEMGRVSVGLCKVIKRIPAAVFELDTELMSEFYQLDADYIRNVVLGVGAKADQVIQGAFGRGDFIKTADGLWCVEFNIASNLGGIWETTAWEQKIITVPVIADYLSRNNLSVQLRNTLRVMMKHVIDQAKRYLQALSRQINVAYVFQKEYLADEAEVRGLRKYFSENYREALQQFGNGMQGDFILCCFDDLRVSDGLVFWGETRIHVVIEVTEGIVPAHILRCQQLGTLNLHNGPFSYLLCNKLNMALLSEFQDSEIFEEKERELIRCHVPWTRRVASGNADFEGNSISLFDFILENRDTLMLKKSLGSSGQFVVAGPSRTPGEWETALRRALEEKDWIVQKYIACPSFPYQYGDYGCCLHDVIWGLFVFGEEYGGAFLRVLPKGRGAVVNRQRGSLDGVVLEIM